MKLFVLVFTILFSCSMEICLAQRSIQNDLYGGLNSDDEKQLNNYVQNLQNNKKEWEQRLSNLRLELSQHRSSTRPSYISEEDWQKEDSILISDIYNAEKNIDLLNKQIHETKKKEDDQKKALEKAFQDAENQRKIEQELHDNQQRIHELQETINRNNEKLAPYYDELHRTVERNSDKVATEDNALNSAISKGYDPDSKPVTQALANQTSSPPPPKKDIRKRFQQKLQESGEKEQQKEDEQDIQALLKQIEELKRQCKILESELQKRKEKKPQK